MSKKRFVLKNKFRFFSFLFFTSLVIFIMAYTASVSGYREPVCETVTVHSGDTLWSIAQQYNNEENDIREYIRDIKKINKMDSNLVIENTSILVPVRD